MFRKLPVLLLLTLLPLSLWATDNQAQQDAVASSLAQFFPRVQAREILPTPIEGMYEIVLPNEDIVYFFPASGHILAGELWSAQNRNLTRESKSRRMSGKIDLFPLDLAVKIGDGPNVVIEVTDPDCPFCRNASEFFDKRDDVTRYVFMLPLDRIHPDAAAKATFILASEDKPAAYHDVFSGMFDTEAPPVLDDKGMLAKHRKIVAEAGVSGTPQFWINGQHVSGFNPKQFEALLSKKAQ